MTSSIAHASRARLALLLLSPVLAMVLISVTVSVLILRDLGTPGQAEADAGLARVGDDFALVIVTDDSSAVAETRGLVAVWGMAVPGGVLVLAALLAWAVAGRVEGAIAQARKSIEDADDSRELRLQEVLHELRTPLAVMGTNLELAGGSPTERSAGYVDAARRAVSRMARTVDDLAGHGGLAVEEGVVELGAIARSVAAENYGPTRSAGVGISLFGHDPVEVAADPDAVRTVVANFMSNAMRSSPRGSTIALDWGVEGDWAWLSVTDEGAGLPPHLHARVFERGWRGRHGSDRDQGSGLGLTIARQLAEAQGGLVTLESEEGGGAVFSLWLPVGLEARRADVSDGDSVWPRSSPWRRVSATL